jgi:hypothetical protein
MFAWKHNASLASGWKKNACGWKKINEKEQVNSRQKNEKEQVNSRQKSIVNSRQKSIVCNVHALGS